MVQRAYVFTLDILQLQFKTVILMTLRVMFFQLTRVTVVVQQCLKLLFYIHIILFVYISHSLNFRLYWISIVFQTFEGIKGMLLHLEEAPSEERVNARFSCAFIGFHALASPGLFLLGRQVLFSLFQDIFNVLDFLQRLNFLLEYSAMIFRYEISLVEGHNNHQVGLYLRDLHGLLRSSVQYLQVQCTIFSLYIYIYIFISLPRDGTYKLH
ncbi:Hypothetical_protein [Hexamita inflata]|uniref:Hypothetical_protein n=1 Tax=Hexamita inflata TaxID=28002 RepID=A0AA86PI80_9EUKA|nr:Hypothetical protein HINF_LOCUS26546 [Hexamita inflata]